MLVIARRENEKFLFPNLGISIQVVKVAGNVARIGIDAPREIRVLREELVDEANLPPVTLPKELTGIADALPNKLKHDFRNQLNLISLGLQIAQRRIENGETDDLEQLVQKLIHQLKGMDRDLTNGSIGSEKSTARLVNAIENNRASENQSRLALIVDDDENERSLLGSLLELSGYDVVVVEDGQAAIDYLKQSFRQPDFVLLDMNMPRKNGQETITEIRNDPQFEKLRVFAVSGSDRDEMQVNVGPRGVDSWFTKPLDARLLVDEMNRQSESQHA